MSSVCIKPLFLIVIHRLLIQEQVEIQEERKSLTFKLKTINEEKTIQNSHVTFFVQELINYK